MQPNLGRILAHLEGDNASDVAGSALALSVVLQQTPPGSLPPLHGTSAKLISLLSSQNFSVKARQHRITFISLSSPLRADLQICLASCLKSSFFVLNVQNNALVALSAAIEASNDIARAALADGAVQELMGVLSSTSDPMSAEEESLCINAMGALGSLGEALPDGLNDIMESGALHQIVELSSPGGSSSLVESAVDTLCKLMSHGFSAVEAAKEAGAIPALGTLLSHDIGDEIIVRVLIGLGMLLKGGDACCLALASTDAAVGALLRLTRQSRDGDIQLIAGEMFRQLGKCEASKEAVLQAVREAHASAQGPKFMDKQKRGGNA